MLVQPLLYALLDGDEAVAQLGVRRRPYDPHAAHGERSPGDTLDDTDTAPRQPGVHAQYAHAPLPSIDCLCRLSGATDNAEHLRQARRRADG
jgi:hypothetical protein